ncbi:sensor histidine kinase [Salinarimonas soli]|nr:HAMP domain-containing sensor histidine kinase [Salinarimonas soli]
MGRIVTQLLSLARLEAADLPGAPAPRPVDLVGVATETAAALTPLAIRARKEIALLAPDEPVTVQGDADAIGEALTNLVDNGLRHSPPGGVVEVEVTAPGIVRVADRGPGVPPSERESIFARFHQASADARPGGGGLGLPIAAAIMRHHGGSIAYADQEGGGALFTLAFCDPSK